MCGACSRCMDHTGLPQLTAARAFWVYTIQAPACSAGVLSKAGPVFCALPRSKLLRFRFSGTLQGHRLSWECILCPSQVSATQATRYLASTLSPVDHASSSPPRPGRSVPQVRRESTLSSVSCLLWGADLRLRTSWQC